MWTAIAGFFGSMFSSSRLVDAAVDGLRKVGGLDEMTGKERGELLLQMTKETKHQSPARRFIAITLTILYALMIVLWLIFNGIGWGFSLDWATSYSGQIMSFMREVIRDPFNYIIAFYFLVDLTGRLGAKK